MNWRRGAMLNRATCRLVARQRSALWIRESWSRRPPAKRAFFLESWPLSFLRAGPPKSRNKAGESVKAGQSRTHPNLETNFAKLRPGPTREPSGAERSRAERGTPSLNGLSAELNLEPCYFCRAKGPPCLRGGGVPPARRAGVDRRAHIVVKKLLPKDYTHCR